jgi:hypothetical protein
MPLAPPGREVRGGQMNSHSHPGGSPRTSASRPMVSAYGYQNGAFTTPSMTMEEMRDLCIEPHAPNNAKPEALGIGGPIRYAPDMALSLCSNCDRHHHDSEPVCTFCGALSATAPVPRRTVSHASRAALVFGGLALSAGCVSRGDVYGGPPPPHDAGPTAESPMPPYGGPPMILEPNDASSVAPKSAPRPSGSAPKAPLAKPK